MTAISDLAEFLTLYHSTARKMAMIKAAATAADIGTMSSLWRSVGKPDQGAIPAASAVPDRTTVGAIGQINPGGGNEQFLAFLQLQSQSRATLLLADRLVHMGGLSGVVTTPQSVSTSALTRYTDGVGVIAAIEIYNTIGTTATTITMDYTDDAGNTGQTSQPVVIGATNRREGGKLIPMSLAVGDRGVRAVNTVTLAATTGTAGNFGVTLYKPIIMLPSLSESSYWSSGDPIQRLGAFLPKIQNDAALWPIIWGNNVGVSLGNLRFLEK